MTQSKNHDDLRTRIAAVLLGDHCVQAMTGPCEDCRAHALRQADAVIRELTAAIPPIVATAIQGYAQSELAGMSYHGASKDAFEVMEKMNREALQIAQYATKHEDWNA